MKRPALFWLTAVFLVTLASLAALEAASYLHEQAVTVPAPQPDGPARWRTIPLAPADSSSASPSGGDPPPVPAHLAPPRLSAAAAILVEPETMTILYARNEHERRAPASTTKIMTALLALERGRLDDIVRVSPRAASVRGSSIHLRAGQEILLADLIWGMMVRSGNDAATAIAEHVAGSEAAFVSMMNQRARELGALNTQFRNPHGLDAPGHYSTAFDLAHLARLAMTFPTFETMVRTREYRLQERGWTWRNTNRLLWRFEGAEGIKTGTTGRAGNCLVAAASRNGMRLISVVLGSHDRWRDSGALLEWGFENFHLVRAASSHTVVAQAVVPQGIGRLKARPARDVVFLLRDDEVGRFRMETQLDRLTPPVRRGQPVGWARVWVGEDLRAEFPLLAADPVPRWTPLRALWYWVKGLWLDGSGWDGSSWDGSSLGGSGLDGNGLREGIFFPST